MKWQTAKRRSICKGCDEAIHKSDYILISREGVFCEACGEIEEENAANMNDEFDQYD